MSHSIVIQKNIYKTFYLVIIFFVSIFFSSCDEKKKNDFDVSLEVGGFEISFDSTPVHKIGPILMPDTSHVDSKFYYDLHRMELNENGMLLLADNSINCVRVIDPNNNKELFFFGSNGKGPGEFQFINELEFNTEVGIITIDNLLLRATIFDNNGKVKRIIKLMQFTDDVDFIDDSLLIISRYQLEFDYKTIQIISINEEKLKYSFGPFLEPRKSFINNLIQLNVYIYNKNWYSFQSITGLIYIKENNSIIMSQKMPYALWIIDLNNYNAIKRFNNKVPFSTYSNDVIEIKNDYQYRITRKSGIQLHPRIIKNKRVSAIFDEENKINYLDIYNIEGSFIRCLKIPALKDKYWVQDFDIDDKNYVMYLLIKNKDKISWIERFKIDPHIFN